MPTHIHKLKLRIEHLNGLIWRSSRSLSGKKFECWWSMLLLFKEMCLDPNIMWCLLRLYSYDYIMISEANFVELLTLKRQIRPNFISSCTHDPKGLCFIPTLVFNYYFSFSLGGGGGGGSLIRLHLTQSAKSLTKRVVWGILFAYFLSMSFAYIPDQCCRLSIKKEQITRWSIVPCLDVTVERMQRRSNPLHCKLQN